MKGVFTLVPAQSGGWPAIAGAIARLVDRTRADADQVVIIGVGERYVQFIAMDDGAAYAETVSNAYLEDHRLGPEHVDALHELGWFDPVDLEPVRKGKPNYWREFPPGTGWLEVATFCVLTLSEVYAAAPTEAVTVTTFAATTENDERSGSHEKVECWPVAVEPPPARPELPPARRCGTHRQGHSPHWIPARKSAELGPGTPRVIESIDDDGWVVFDDGTRVWNHDPRRLRVAVGTLGRSVRLGDYGILRVPHATGAYCFSVSTEASECGR